MSDSSPVAARAAELDGPVRDALELLQRLVAALKIAPHVAVHSIDRDGIVQFWNDHCAQLYGVACADAIGRPLRSLASHGDQQPAWEEAIAAIWHTARASAPRDWPLLRPDGGARWVYCTHFPVPQGGRPLQVFCMAIDVSERKQAESALAMAAQVFENCRDAILVADSARTVIAANPAAVTLFGQPMAALLGSSLARLGDGAHDDGFYAHIWDYVGEHQHWEGELIARHASGVEFPARVALTSIPGAAGQPSNYMAMVSDLTERARVDEQTRHLAEHDFLTDLPNRVLFLDRLQQAFASARRKQGRFAVMFIDLDRFKGINDSFGHQVGDIVLKEVAQRLTRCVRGADTVSRQGGDEFVVILADIGGIDQAAHVAAMVMQAVAQPVTWGEHSLSLSVSIGIAVWPGDGNDVETLLQHADVAMYHAKQNGRNAMSFFSPEMNAHVVERAQLERSLRQALERQEFELAWQPEIDIASGRATAVEALIRWRHPQRGLLLPGDFIPVAEQCGLIAPIGDWVLRAACAQARAWRDAGLAVAVAVHLSQLQFVHHDLARSVADALAEAHLPPEALDLEITEAVITGGDAHTADTLAAMRERGVRLTVDNFGTGVSSLGYLRRVRLSKLKIDRSFIGEIESAPGDAAIIPAIIALARSLRLQVVAEGVETAAQLRYLQLHGCDRFQGHFDGQASGRPDLTPRRR